MARKKTINETFVGDDGGSFIAGGDDSQFTPKNNLGVNRPADMAPMGDLAPQALDTKAAFMSGIVNVLTGMSKEDLEKIYMSVTSRVEGMTDTGAPPQATAQANMASLAPMSKMESVWSDDLDTLFAEQFEDANVKSKIKTIFEAAVNAQTQLYWTMLDEKYIERAEKAAELVEQEFEARLKEKEEELTEQVDAYLTHMAEEWLQENRVNAEASIKVELAESFLNDMLGLVQKYNLTLESEKVNVVEEALKEVEELKEQLNTVVNENIELKKKSLSEERNALIESASDGLTKSQAIRLKQLAENVSVTSIDEFKEKLGFIKESLIEKKSVKSSIEQTLFEDVSTLEQEGNPLPDNMRLYVDAIARSAKR